MNPGFTGRSLPLQAAMCLESNPTAAHTHCLSTHLQCLARPVEHGHVHHNVILVHRHKCLGVHRVAEPRQLQHAVQAPPVALNRLSQPGGPSQVRHNLHSGWQAAGSSSSAVVQAAGAGSKSRQRRSAEGWWGAGQFSPPECHQRRCSAYATTQHLSPETIQRPPPKTPGPTPPHTQKKTNTRPPPPGPPVPAG